MLRCICFRDVVDVLAKTTPEEYEMAQHQKEVKKRQKRRSSAGGTKNATSSAVTKHENDVVAQDGPTGGVKKHPYVFHVVTGKRPYVLATGDPTVFYQWIDMLKKQHR